ncbi:MAG TPA: S9 family peptidase [Allosphingosinicella sp.]|nr:S9 family peptidase [Allosphingosinicella sp.]
MLKPLLLAATALVLLPAAAPPADPVAAFGAREGVLDASLSPSGSKLAFIAPGPGQGNMLYTVDIGAGTAPVLATTASGSPERLHSCSWVSEARLVCTVYLVSEAAAIGPVGASRIIALDADGRNLKMLSRDSRPDDLYVSFGGGSVVDISAGDGSLLMARNYVPEAKIGTRFEDKREGYGLDRIDTKSLSAKVVEPARKHASRYFSDGQGNIRLMATRDIAGATGYESGKINHFYRTKASRDWQSLGSVDAISEQGFFPIAVDPKLDIAYGIKRHQGRDALFSVTLDGAKRESLVFSHPQVDVDGTIGIGRSNRVIAATYATEKREAVYFDPRLAALAKALSRALPNHPLIHFMDASADENKLLLWAGSDTDPGRYYLYDNQAGSLNELMLARPQLEGATLAPMKPMTYKAADGTEVPAYLTMPIGGAQKNLPAIVMPHGGPNARDEWGFDWLAQYFASRGYAVLQPNYRGSAGYGESWFKNQGFRSWKTAIGDVNDAGRWLAAQGIADPSKLAIVGWSYGGYAALQSGALDPDLYKAVVAIAPVTDLAGLLQEARGWTNARYVSSMIGSGPHVSEGSPAQNARKLKAPVLMFHGDRDLNVPIAQARLMEGRLKEAGKTVELVVYPKLDHQIDDSAARRDMLKRSDAFLRAALKLP